MATKVDFKIIADAMECPRVEIADKAELESLLNFPPNGVSPLGNNAYPVFIEESLMSYPTILVGSGSIGIEIELEPAELVRLTSAQLKPVCLKA
jgi:Cys-tRNA(Pro)/Cys-tRNA(Cys) deacylase